MRNRRRKCLWVMAVLLMSPLVFEGGQQQCVQTIAETSEIPFSYDPNQLAVNPWSGQRDIMCWIVTEIGTEIEFSGDVCDPEDDPIKDVWVSDPNVFAFAYDPNATTWTLRYTPSSIGITYGWVASVDAPVVRPETARTQKVNFMVAATPRNQPPAIRCGGGT